MHELTDFIKRPNLRNMGIEDRDKVQAKRIHNTFNKMVTKNFPNLKKVLPIHVQETSRTPKRLHKVEAPHSMLLKQQAQRIEK
jgi:hypothetical protein